jgi:hypothetical protein
MGQTITWPATAKRTPSIWSTHTVSAAAFDDISRLNQRHAVLREGGKMVVITQEYELSKTASTGERCPIRDLR